MPTCKQLKRYLNSVELIHAPIGHYPVYKMKKAELLELATSWGYCDDWEGTVVLPAGRSRPVINSYLESKSRVDDAHMMFNYAQRLKPTTESVEDFIKECKDDNGGSWAIEGEPITIEIWQESCRTEPVLNKEALITAKKADIATNFAYYDLDLRKITDDANFTEEERDMLLEYLEDVLEEAGYYY